MKTILASKGVRRLYGQVMLNLEMKGNQTKPRKKFWSKRERNINVLSPSSIKAWMVTYLRNLLMQPLLTRLEMSFKTLERYTHGEESMFTNLEVTLKNLR